MILGFTGTARGITDAQRRGFIDVLDGFVDRNEFHHGDCIGADAEAHALAAERMWKMCIHPPTDPKARAFCEGDVYYEVLPYLRRNDMIVAAANHLIATPFGPEKVRSGTWYTVRQARRRGIPLTIVWPDGRVTREGQ